MENNKQERKQRALREIGKVFVNFGNLTFASLVLGTIIKGNYDRALLLLFGGIIAVLLITMGIAMLIGAEGEEK